MDDSVRVLWESTLDKFGFKPDSDGVIVWKSQVVLGENKSAVKIAEFWDAASFQLVLCRCCHAVGVIAALEGLL